MTNQPRNGRIEEKTSPTYFARRIQKKKDMKMNGKLKEGGPEKLGCYGGGSSGSGFGFLGDEL